MEQHDGTSAIEIVRILEETAALHKALAKQAGEIERVARLISDALAAGRTLYVMGNGGSAADAQHLAGEFVNRFLIERPPLPAIALTTDTSVLTSISNDYGYVDSFSKQVKALGKEGDVAIGISTSGSAANVIKAVKVAKEMGLKTVGLTGNDGGELAKVTDIAVIVDSPVTPRIQEVHITIGHVICEMVDRMLFQHPT